MFKVNNKGTRTTSGVSIVNFEQVNAGWVACEQHAIEMLTERSFKPPYLTNSFC